jgi:hypothetical protein
MDTSNLTDAIAKPLGTVGMLFYFSPQSAERAKTIGMDLFTLYGAGRGGVLGDRSPQEIEDIFYFFKPGMISELIAKARSLAPIEVGVAAHMGAANDFADVTFGGVEDAVMESFSSCVTALVASLPKGRWPIADGYASVDLPSTPRYQAHRWAVVMRELRGGIHVDTVKDLGLSPSVACQLDPHRGSFSLLGYSDEDRVEETDEMIALRDEIEVETSRRQAALLEVLDQEQRAALADGAAALRSAVRSPVAAT